MYNTNSFVVNSTFGFAAFGGGDVLSQFGQRAYHLVKEDGSVQEMKLDVARSVRVGCLGILINGFGLAVWYKTLDRAFGSSRSSMVGVGLKCLADQIIFAPLACGAYLGWSHLWNPNLTVSQQVSNASQNIQAKLFQVWLADCELWPAANLIGFRFVPTVFRPTFMSFVQLCWQTYMSTISHLEDEDLTVVLENEETVSEQAFMTLTGADSEQAFNMLTHVTGADPEQLHRVLLPESGVILPSAVCEGEKKK